MIADIKNLKKVFVESVLKKISRFNYNLLAIIIITFFIHE